MSGAVLWVNPGARWCESCDGTGWDAEDTWCPWCGGTGKEGQPLDEGAPRDAGDWSWTGQELLCLVEHWREHFIDVKGFAGRVDGLFGVLSVVDVPAVSGTQLTRILDSAGINLRVAMLIAKRGRRRKPEPVARFIRYAEAAS